MSQLDFLRGPFSNVPPAPDREGPETPGTEESVSPLEEDLVDEIEEELERTRFPPGREKVSMLVRGVEVEVKKKDGPVEVALSFHVRRKWESVKAARESVVPEPRLAPALRGGP